MIHQPSPDAAHFPFGRDRLRRTAPGAVAAFLLALAMPAAGVVHGFGVGTWIFAVLWFLALGGIAAFLGWSGRADRALYLAFDATGVWRLHDGAHVVIPWASLEAAGAFWCPPGAGGSGRTMVSLELCPRGGVDDRDPALSPLVVEDPSGVPRVADRRYRIGVPVFAVRRYGVRLLEAAETHAGAALWTGRHERPAGYLRPQDLIN